MKGESKQVFEIAKNPDGERKLLNFAKRNPKAFYKAVAELFLKQPIDSQTPKNYFSKK